MRKSAETSSGLEERVTVLERLSEAQLSAIELTGAQANAVLATMTRLSASMGKTIRKLEARIKKLESRLRGRSPKGLA